MRQHGVLAVAVLAGLALAAGCSTEQEDDDAQEAKPAAAAVLPGAQSYAVEAPDSLRALATVPIDSAIRLALVRVPNGLIEKVELEREDGAVVWSFDIRVPGRAGIAEVAVDAVTGAVGAVEHEDAAAEAREAREDSAAARRPVRSGTPAANRP